MNIRNRILNATVLAIAAGSSLAVPAIGDVADDHHGTRSLTVVYGDLDLSQPAGIDAMYGRLSLAAERVCAPREDARSPARRRIWERCVATSIDRSVAEVNNPLLSDVHSARTGRPVVHDERIARAPAERMTRARDEHVARAH